ncbi:hypothetical protein KIM372_04400 [Bombiscardovia nodaiensis]|uniref:Uncharacterized protein n=1 Tax=Bombiscardovia nodaiensis TaxID=2932181 RepID=A0ABM8B726_9BIFI|nr:hypothetical protein KIM372_04400 [Bombiscardovia nodaiensis]
MGTSHRFSLKRSRHGQEQASYQSPLNQADQITFSDPPGSQWEEQPANAHEALQENLQQWAHAGDGEREEEDQAEPITFVYQGSQLAQLLAQRQRKHLSHLIILALVLAIPAEGLNTAVSVQQPDWLFGSPRADNGLAAFKNSPDLLTFGLCAFSLAMAVIGIALSTHVRRRGRSLGTNLNSFAVWTRRFCIFILLSAVFTLSGGFSTFLDQVGSDTLPLLPSNSRLLGSEYKTPKSWLAEGTHRSDLKATLLASGQQSVASFKTKGLRLEIYVLYPDIERGAAEPLLEQAGQQAADGMKNYGVSKCEVVISGIAKNNQLIPTLTFTPTR